MIQKVWLKERTADSIPFMSAEEKCHLSQLGYAEDEYFFSGTANVYDEKEDKIPYVICKDAPYTSRMMIRRPKDPAKFSGDIYIGLTSKSDVLPALYMYDEERYKDINWSNPMPQRPAPENMEGFRFGFDPRFEYGLFWDMLADVGKLLKNQIPGNPIKDYGDYKVYLTGWSQSTWYLMRWLKSFAYLPENYDQEPLYDGYVSAGGTDHQAPLNTYSVTGSGMLEYTGIHDMGAREPLIAVNTESENIAASWAGDSDTPGHLFRFYEFAGSTHDTKNNIEDWYRDDPQIKKIGWPLYYEGVDGAPNDYPYEVLFHAVFRNLYAWVRNGIPAPHAHRIPRNSRLQNRTDAFGNALGGVRTAAINYPTCRYCLTSRKADDSINTLFGHIEPFRPAMLNELYKNVQNYEALVREDCERQVAKGFMLKEDIEPFVEYLIETAKSRGLNCHN